MTKVTITKIANMAFLNFFNSKEVYSMQGFDSVRKASNFAKKWSYEVFESLPVGIAQYNQNNQ